MQGSFAALPYPVRKRLAFPMRHSTNQRGSAAAQCGRASPFRCFPFILFEAAPHESAAEPPVNFKNLTVRQSLTALCCGKATSVRLSDTTSSQAFPTVAAEPLF